MPSAPFFDLSSLEFALTFRRLAPPSAAGPGSTMVVATVRPRARRSVASVMTSRVQKASSLIAWANTTFHGEPVVNPCAGVRVSRCRILSNSSLRMWMSAWYTISQHSCPNRLFTSRRSAVATSKSRNAVRMQRKILCHAS